MTEELVIYLGQESLKTAGLLAMPLLGSALIVGLMVTGLVVSIFQAITQINEATLTFIPKILVVAIVIIIAGPWMLDVLTGYTSGLFSNIAEFVRN